MRFFEITNPASKIVETFYHGSNHGLRPGVYVPPIALRTIESINEAVMVDEIQRSGPWNPKITIDKALEHKSELKFLGSYDGVNVFNTVVRNTMYVLLQKDKKTIGAAMLEKNHLSNIDGWYMTEIGLRLAARGNGHGYGLYKFLLKKGFTLFSGNSQSENGEQVWKNLMNDTHVTVKALRLNMNPDENDSLDPVDINEIDPWDDEWTVLMATKNDLYESVMIDEISTNDWWNMSDADMDTKLNVIKMNSLQFFDDIDATYSVYSKVDKEFNDRLKKYKLYIYDKNAQRLIGYARVLSDRQRTWRMTVHEIALRPPYRGKNIAYDFYLMLLSSGYTVASDGQQTKGGASIWKKLMNDPKVKVTAYDDVNRREVAPADAWNHENPHAQLQAVISESVMVDEIKALSGPYKKENGWDEKVQKKTNGEMGDDEKVGEIDGIDVVKYGSEDDGQLIFVLQDGEKRVGYLELELRTYAQEEDEPFDGWFCETGLNSDYVGRGIGYRLYELVISLGYVLVSGHEQTGGSQSIWKKLMVNPRVRVRAIMFGEYTRLVPVNTVNPWSDNVLLMASKKRSVRESVMIDEISVIAGPHEPNPKETIAKIKAGRPTKVGSVSVTVDVFKSEDADKDVVYFALFTNKMARKSNSLIGFVTLVHDGRYWNPTPYMKEKFRRSGWATKLYKFILDQGYCLLSGGVQSQSGSMVWKTLMKDPKYKFEVWHDDEGARELKPGENPWNTIAKFKLTARLNEGLEVVAIPPQPKGLERCTAVTCNAILSHYKRPVIKSAGGVPRTARACFDLLQHFKLKVQPDAAIAEKHMSVKTFANLHQTGAWFIGVPGHAMALIDGKLYDTENKGLDGRIIRVVARVIL